MSFTVAKYEATEEMSIAYEEGKSAALEHFQDLVNRANKLYELMRKPRVNGVQNGAYVVLHSLFEAYYFSAQSLVLTLHDEQGRDWFPWMVLRNRKVRGDRALPGWMQRLIDRNDGVIPDTWTHKDVMSDADIAREKENENG